MDYEQDYLMRMIKQMIKALMNFLLGKDNTAYELPIEEHDASSDGFYYSLIDLADKGKINEAENLLSKSINYGDKWSIHSAIAFYGYLNELDDEFLKAHDYSRDEIAMGLKEVAKYMGLEQMFDVADLNL